MRAEGVDAFVTDWNGKNNYVCPPICVIHRVLLHMSNCKAQGALILPLWYSAPFWPIRWFVAKIMSLENSWGIVLTCHLIKMRLALVVVAEFLGTRT